MSIDFTGNRQTFWHKGGKIVQVDIARYKGQIATVFIDPNRLVKTQLALLAHPAMRTHKQIAGFGLEDDRGILTLHQTGS